jgi:hypothetical protein
MEKWGGGGGGGSIVGFVGRTHFLYDIDSVNLNSFWLKEYKVQPWIWLLPQKKVWLWLGSQFKHGKELIFGMLPHFNQKKYEENLRDLSQPQERFALNF